MNILTYTLQLKDKMTSTLSRIGVSTDSTTQEVRNLKSEVQSLNKVSLGGFFSTLSKIGAFIGVGALLGKTISGGMEQGMKEVSFEVLFGSADKAKAMIDDINEYASKAYNTTAVTNAVQMMSGFGIASDEIMRNISAIGDIAMGKVENFNSLTLAFSQMSSTGKLMGQDLLQMINAGFNPLGQMAKTTGKSVEQLKIEMSKGLITSQMVKQSFYDAVGAGGQFNGMMEKIANTSGGLWKGALADINKKLLEFYKIIDPYINAALRTFRQLLKDPIATIKELADSISTQFPIITGIIVTATAAVVAHKVAILSLAGVQAVVTGLKSVLAAYEVVVFAVKNSTSLWTAAQWLLNVALSANPIGVIIGLITALAAAITFVVVKVNGWGKAWNHVVNGMKLIFQAFVKTITFLFDSMVNGLMIGLNWIKKGWYEFKEAVGLGDSSENQRMLDKIHADTEARKKAVTNGAKEIAVLNKKAANEFKQAWNSLSWGNKEKNKITSAGLPGTETAASIAGTSGIGQGISGSSAGKETANSIATGGTKTTHITINLGELVGTININKNGFSESAENMRDKILDELTRVLTMAQGQTT